MIEAVWRIESARVTATLAGLTHDVGLAEESAQDALVAALEQWPESGVPDHPGAWLTAVGKRRALDVLRKRQRWQRRLDEVGRDPTTGLAPAGPDADVVADAVGDDIGDDLLRLVFTACHPVLSVPSRVALTLRLLGGLTTGEIARAFLASESTVAQRISRAKKTLARENVPFAVPSGAELAPRLASVTEVVYLIFNEGYAATVGEDWMRPELCAEALRLGRVLTRLAPTEPEAHGLVALMELQHSRASARTGPDGEPVLLAEQDRSRWDRLLIRRGLAALERARALTDAPGPYALQAEIAACHARAATIDATDWARVAALYGELARVQPSSVVELNRAVAVSRAHGPAAGLALVDALRAERALRAYHLLPSVRGDLLARLGRHDEARGEFARAAELTRNDRERALLRRRAETGGRSTPTP